MVRLWLKITTLLKKRLVRFRYKNPNLVGDTKYLVKFRQTKKGNLFGRRHKK